MSAVGVAVNGPFTLTVPSQISSVSPAITASRGRIGGSRKPKEFIASSCTSPSSSASIGPPTNCVSTEFAIRHQARVPACIPRNYMESSEEPVEQEVDETVGTVSQNQTSQLAYIPPGLTCELDPAEGGSLSICAVGRFDAGHIWGPYLIQLSAGAQQLFCFPEDGCTKLKLSLSVKNFVGAAEEGPILLGEEHLWIRLLHETGTRSSTPEHNVDLSLDPMAKTLTLVVTKNIEANEKLRGILQIRSGSLKTPASSSIQTSVGSDPTCGTKGFSSCLLNPGIQTVGACGAPKRDKKCHYCGIPFSNLDTLSAHMTYYCSRRSQLGSETITPNPVSSTSSPTETTGSKTGSSSFGTTVRLSTVSKRPTNRINMAASQPVGVASGCLPTYPFQLFSKSPTVRSGCVPSGNNLMEPTHLNTTDPLLSTDLENALCLLNSTSVARTTLAAALQPYLAKLSSTTETAVEGRNSIPSQTSTEFQNILPPLGTRLPDTRSKLKTNDSNRIHPSSMQPTKHHTDGYVLAPKEMPTYCEGCKQFFISDFLYVCHLKMSLHLVNSVEGRHSNPDDKVCWPPADNIRTECPFALASAVSKLGLMLAAPLLTVDGVHYVPVNPTCGLLYNNQRRNESQTFQAQRVSADGHDTNGEEDVPKQCSSAAAVAASPVSAGLPSQNVLNALDLSCPLIATESGASMLPIQRLFERNLTANNCQRKINEDSESPNKHLFPTGIIDVDDGNTANSRTSGYISPDLFQLVASLLSNMAIPSSTSHSPTKSGPQTKTDPALSEVPLNLPQLITQLYLNNIPCNSQNLQHFPGSLDNGLNSTISSSTTEVTTCARDNAPPSVPYRHSQLLSAHSSLPHPSIPPEVVPAISIFNSVYPGGVCEAFGHVENYSQNKHPTPSLSLKNPIQSGAECSVSPANSPPHQNTPHRPYLCTFCHTRFLAYTTFQAHQQSYCQARRDAVHNQNAAAITSTSTIVTTGSGTTVSTNQQPCSGNSSAPAKRRRTQPISPHSSLEYQPSGKLPDGRLNFSSSNVSSASGSGDEGEAKRAKEGSASNKLENTKVAQKISSASTEMEAKNTVPAWEPCGIAELRCSACGYVGQTSRGMKMHKRLHECKGVSVREIKPVEKKRGRENDNDDSMRLMVDRPREQQDVRNQLVRMTEEPIKSESV